MGSLDWASHNQDQRLPAPHAASNGAFVSGSVCLACARRCDLSRREAFCGAYGLGGEPRRVTNHLYGQVVHAAVDAIEKKPVYHYRPGTHVLTLGTLGCTLRCKGCLNHHWAWVRPDVQAIREQTMVKTPEAVVERAIAEGCEGLAWSFNEAAVWLPFVQDCNALAHARGLYTVLVTNGYYPVETVRALAQHLDVWRVDLKDWHDAYYQSQMGVSDGATVARAATLAAAEAGCHVELVSLLMPGRHEAWEAIAPLATWVRDALGPQTPWHLLKFHPQHLMRHVPSFDDTVARTLARQAMALGLAHVYVGGDAFDQAKAIDTPSHAVARGQLRHYDWHGPQGEFLRISVERDTGRMAFVGDESLLQEVLAACDAQGLPLRMGESAPCG